MSSQLTRVASGGELARFLLALKVCLEESEHPRSLIFDEVRFGRWGAVAAAVGERLSRLGASTPNSCRHPFPTSCSQSKPTFENSQNQH